NLVGENGVGPLYAAINLMWAPRAGYPQPRAHMNQQLSYLDFMKQLLDAGADPNQRVNKKVWYSNFNFDQSGIDEAGATPFCRAAAALVVATGASGRRGSRPGTARGGRRAAAARRVSPAPPPARRRCRPGVRGGRRCSPLRAAATGKASTETPIVMSRAGCS